MRVLSDRRRKNSFLSLGVLRMQGPPTSFWGKLDQDAQGRPLRWHPLIDHCADVGACCEALLQRTLLRRRLAALGGMADLTDVQVARLSVVASLHDAGKVNLGFQRKADPRSHSMVGHVRPLFALIASGFPERSAVLTALGTDELLGWGPEGLLFASLAHHGQPIAADAHGAEADPTQWRASGALDPVATLRDLASRARAWFSVAASRTATFPDRPELQHAFSGLVTLADWLGSDTRFFPFSEGEGPDRIAFAREQAREALHAVGLDAEPARAQLSLDGAWFERLLRFAPRDAQRAVLDLGVPPSGGGLVVLESETGSGKTEAALARFFSLFHAGAVDGLYFALPTRTAATQIHRRVLESVRRAFPDPDRRPPVVLAVPGYVRVDDIDGKHDDPKLAPFGTLWPDDVADRMRWRRWAAENPKRYLAGEVVVGTVDQVLLSSLRVKHAHLRATSLIRHLLVVDEVHASDAYMNRVLEAVLSRHLAAGGHAFLMSATLGAAARQRFLDDDRGDIQSLADAETQPYPALSVREGEWVSLIGAGKAPSEKAVTVELAAAMERPTEVAQRALAAARAGARVLVIRNTVGDAVAAQQEIEAMVGDDVALLFSCGGVPAPHHSRYAKEDRELLDAALERRFGKAASTPCVVVATQTVQQSLDIDADFLITDLCPMDVLLQRIGRLHRHDRQDRARPEPFACARGLVLVPDAPDLSGHVSRTGEARGRHGMGRVYRDLRVLQATWDLLAAEGELVIPRRNRTYVERTTHPEALDALGKSAPDRWRSHRTWLAGTLMAEVGLATLNQASWAEPFGAHGWAQDDGRIATRLGAGDRVIAFDMPITTPFGAESAALTMPAWMAAGASEDERPASVAFGTGGAVTFRFGGRDYVYDRLGLRRHARGERAEEEDADGQG